MSNPDIFKGGLKELTVIFFQNWDNGISKFWLFGKYWAGMLDFQKYKLLYTGLNKFKYD